MLRIPSWIKRNPVWSIAFLSVVALVGITQAKERSLWIQGSATKGSDQIVGKIDKTVNNSFTQSTPNSASLAQSMRQEFNSKEQCFEEIKPNVFNTKHVYCVKGNRVLLQPYDAMRGYIGRRYAGDISTYEWFLENGKLIAYICASPGVTDDCEGKVWKEVYIKTKSRQEVLESKEKFNNYFASGNAKNKSKDYQGAIADYSKAIAINPQDADAYSNRGIAKHGLKDYQGAIADYSKAIEIDPDDLVSYNFRGRLKAGFKDYQGAIADFSKAIKIYPQYAGAFVGRGFAKSGLKDYQGAIADSSKAIEIDPQNAGAFGIRGVAKSGLKDYQGAIADLSKAIEIDPQNAGPFGIRAEAKYRLGDQQGACHDYKKAVSLGSQLAEQSLNSEKGASCRNMQ